MSWRNLRAVFKRRQAERELDDEMHFHLEKQIEQHMAAGMSPDEARRQALIAFGGVQQTKENVRETRGIHFFDVIAQDTRYAWRLLLKSPAFTFIAVVTLALGIGMNTAIFSLIDAVLYRSLPVRDSQNLVVLKWEARNEPSTDGMSNFGDCNDHHDKAALSGCSLPLPLLTELSAHTNVFSSLAASTGAAQMDLGGSGPARRVQGQFISGGYFETLGIMPAVGRLFSAADDQEGAAPVVVVNYKLWQSEFGGSNSVVGKTVRLNNKPYLVVGVTEPRFTALSLGNSFDLWVPLTHRKDLAARWFPSDMSFFEHTILGRVTPGIPLAQAEAAASVVFRNATVQQEKPIFKSEDEPHLKLMPAQKELRGRYDLVLRPLYVLMLCVGIILLIACANVAGLLLARSASREREMAVRLALGAKRLRLLGQLLVESLTLSAMGGALGLLMAVWGARVLMALLFSGAARPPVYSPHLDWRVLMFTAGMSILTGLLFGMAPAFRGLRVDLTPSLKAGDALCSAGSRRRRFSTGNLLVATQVALAVVVLATAGLMVRTLSNLKSVDPGFNTNNLLLFSLNPRLDGYKGPQIGNLYRELKEKFSSLPGVMSVSYSWVAPLSGGHMMTMFHRPGTPVESKDIVKVEVNQIGPDFFTTLRIPKLAGRDLTAAEFDAAAQTTPMQPVKGPQPVVVNQTFVHTYFLNQNPLGQVFGDSLQEGRWPAFPGYEIVGVVGDAKFSSLRDAFAPAIYAAAKDGDASFELRTSNDPASLITAVRKTLSSVDNNLTMVQVDTQDGEIDRQLSEDRMVAQLSTFFGLLALVLACMGLYGLLSYEVTRRTREIGIRMAIGAESHDVVALVLKKAAVLIATGAAVGIAVAVGVTRFLTTFLYGVKAGDPITLLAVAALLAVVALAACYIPARRATKVDPLVALRYE